MRICYISSPGVISRPREIGCWEMVFSNGLRGGLGQSISSSMYWNLLTSLSTIVNLSPVVGGGACPEPKGKMYFQACCRGSEEHNLI